MPDYEGDEDMERIVAAVAVENVPTFTGGARRPPTAPLAVIQKEAPRRTLSEALTLLTIELERLRGYGAHAHGPMPDVPEITDEVKLDALYERIAVLSQLNSGLEGYL